MGRCSIKNLTRGFAQLATVRIFRWSISRKLARVIVPGSLPLAIAPQRFAAGTLGFSASLVGACGFVMADSAQGSNAAAPGRCLRCSIRDWQPARTGSAPTLPQRDLCGYAASPGSVFSAPARGTGCETLMPDREHSPRQEAFPSYNRPRKRCGGEQKECLEQKESNWRHSGT